MRYECAARHERLSAGAAECVTLAAAQCVPLPGAERVARASSPEPPSQSAELTTASDSSLSCTKPTSFSDAGAQCGALASSQHSGPHIRAIGCPQCVASGAPPHLLAHDLADRCSAHCYDYPSNALWARSPNDHSSADGAADFLHDTPTAAHADGGVSADDERVHLPLIPLYILFQHEQCQRACTREC
jgi:hypothetical protein